MGEEVVFFFGKNVADLTHVVYTTHLCSGGEGVVFFAVLKLEHRGRL
jgi:hypothetical protein